MPADKSFNGDMEFADLMSDSDTQLLIAQIMDWTQDPNWPDTTRILEILHQHEQILIPYIKYALRDQDPEWKEWILTYLAAYFPDEYLAQLQEELELLTHGDMYDEEYKNIQKISKELYARIKEK
jgi:hypothetical protein